MTTEDDLDDLPDFLDRAKTPSKPAAEKKIAPRASAPAKPAIPFKDAGDLVPLTDRAALDFIKQSKPTKEKTMRTQSETAKPKKLPVPPPKGARIARPKTAAPKKVAAPKKALPKAVAKVVTGERAPAGTGIGALAKSLILEGLDNEQVLAKVKKAFPGGATNSSNISWYRMDLRRKGILTDTPVGAAAAKALKASKKSVKKTSKKVAH